MTTPVEERLRGGLAARADRITAADLRPASLPSALGTGGRRRRLVPRRWPWPLHRLRPSREPVPHPGQGRRRAWVSPRRARGIPVLAGVAVAAVAVVFAVLFAWRPQQSTPPDRAPYLPGGAPTSGAPTDRQPDQPSPQPSRSPITEGPGAAPRATSPSPPGATTPLKPPESTSAPVTAPVTVPPQATSTFATAAPGTFAPETASS